MMMIYIYIYIWLEFELDIYYTRTTVVLHGPIQNWPWLQCQPLKIYGSWLWSGHMPGSITTTPCLTASPLQVLQKNQLLQGGAPQWCWFINPSNYTCIYYKPNSWPGKPTWLWCIDIISTINLTCVSSLFLVTSFQKPTCLPKIFATWSNAMTFQKEPDPDSMGIPGS